MEMCGINIKDSDESAMKKIYKKLLELDLEAMEHREDADGLQPL